MSSMHERLVDLFTARPIEINLPIGVERRVRAHLHRLNADIASCKGDGFEFEGFHLEDDLGVAMLALTEWALEFSEDAAEVRYDHITGRPIDNLEELIEE